mmetsp:Transcript_69805/g.227079  ORF Transcript_69805/g.227079 Transcript_69805/m.227079 type:complete len:220 (+) Transcript_69805:166-825(+)
MGCGASLVVNHKRIKDVEKPTYQSTHCETSHFLAAGQPLCILPGAVPSSCSSARPPLAPAAGAAEAGGSGGCVATAPVSSAEVHRPAPDQHKLNQDCSTGCGQWPPLLGESARVQEDSLHQVGQQPRCGSNGLEGRAPADVHPQRLHIAQEVPQTGPGRPLRGGTVAFASSAAAGCGGAQGAARAGPEVRMSLALLLNCYAEAFRMQRENPDNLSGRGI